MPRPDFPASKFRFFPRWSLWGLGGGPPPLVSNYSKDALGGGGGVISVGSEIRTVKRQKQPLCCGKGQKGLMQAPPCCLSNPVCKPARGHPTSRPTGAHGGKLLYSHERREVCDVLQGYRPSALRHPPVTTSRVGGGSGAFTHWIPQGHIPTHKHTKRERERERERERGTV